MAQDVESLDAAVREGELSIKIEKRLTKLMNSHDGVKGLKGRFRSLEVVIANNSSYNLLFKKGYFSSGTWFSNPDDCIKPVDATIATLANRAGSILCGVTGGMSWEIEGTEKFLVLGFTNPTIGCYKLWIGVRKEPEPEYGYQHSEDDTHKFRSENGFALVGRLGESTIAMKRFIFAIGDLLTEQEKGGD